MDTIKRQASAQVVINYGGTLVSMLAVILIYPLDKLEGYGLAQFLSMTAMFLAPFVTLGVMTITVKFFPEFENTAKQKGYLANVLLLSGVAMLAFGILGWLLKEPIFAMLNRLHFDVPMLRRQGLPLALTTVFIVLARVFTWHSSNYKQTAVPAIFNNLLPKVALPILVLLTYYGILTYDKLSWSWTGVFAIAVIGHIINLRSIGAWDMAWRPGDLTRPLLRRISSFAAYNGVSWMGSTLANRVDVIMVTLLLGEKLNGVYMTAFFIAAVIEIPMQATWTIVSPLLSKAWNENDLAEIKKLYQRSGANLFVVGIVAYLLCLGNIDAVFSLTADYEGLSKGITAFALLGAAKLLDMATSVNTQILIYSKSYRVHTFFIIILGTLNLVLNYVFIESHGVTGAALATFVSVFTYNLLKSGFIYLRYGMWPVSRDFLRVMLFAALCIGLFLIFPRMGNPFLHIALYTAAMSLFALFLLYALKVNTDFLPFFIEKARALVRRFR